MLIQFSVENYLSIKDKVVLSLLASKDKEHPDFLINHDNKKCLKSAVIYGANASGKSNVLNALNLMILQLSSRVLLKLFLLLMQFVMRMDFRLRIL